MRRITQLSFFGALTLLIASTLLFSQAVSEGEALNYVIKQWGIAGTLSKLYDRRAGQWRNSVGQFDGLSFRPIATGDANNTWRSAIDRVPSGPITQLPLTGETIHIGRLAIAWNQGAYDMFVASVRATHPTLPDAALDPIFGTWKLHYVTDQLLAAIIDIRSANPSSVDSALLRKGIFIDTRPDAPIVIGANLPFSDAPEHTWAHVCPVPDFLPAAATVFDRSIICGSSELMGHPSVTACGGESWCGMGRTTAIRSWKAGSGRAETFRRFAWVGTKLVTTMDTTVTP